MTKEEIDTVVCDILVHDGPDGHIDWHGVIVDFIQAILRDQGREWVQRYNAKIGNDTPVTRKIIP